MGRSLEDLLALTPPPLSQQAEYFYINPRTGKAAIEIHRNLGPPVAGAPLHSGCMPRLTYLIARYVDSFTNRCVPVNRASTFQALITTALVCIYGCSGPIRLSPYDKAT